MSGGGVYDVICVGGGIAGAGLAYWLKVHTWRTARILVLEAEDIAGYHTTGRSAAFYAETYGGPVVQPLTSASKAFLADPPADLSPRPFLTRRGALHIFSNRQADAAWRLHDSLAPALPDVRMLNADETRRLAPHVRRPDLAGAVHDPDCGDLDVAGLHQAYLGAARRAGVAVKTDAPVTAAVRRDGQWRLTTPRGTFAAPVLVNAAGAWADELARLARVPAVGMQPLRRTVVTVPRQDAVGAHPHAPLVLDAEERFYIKPEGEGYLVSPADETPSAPCDAQPEEEDVARAVAHLEETLGVTVPRLGARWAGLRTFAPDRAPVIGFDPAAEGFFWHAGQGGWGIQTSPAWCALSAALISGHAVPDHLGRFGVDPARYAPDRFKRAA